MSPFAGGRGPLRPAPGVDARRALGLQRAQQAVQVGDGDLPQALQHRGDVLRVAHHRSQGSSVRAEDREAGAEKRPWHRAAEQRTLHLRPREPHPGDDSPSHGDGGVRAPSATSRAWPPAESRPSSAPHRAVDAFWAQRWLGHSSPGIKDHTEGTGSPSLPKPKRVRWTLVVQNPP